MTDHEKKLKAAQKRVAGMDKLEGHEDRSIGTLWIALETGLRGTDDGPAYDALAMLIDIRNTISQVPSLNILSIKTMFQSLDDGDKVSIKLVPLVDPANN